MVARVLVLGGYGNFGGYIAKSLAASAHIQLIVGGRSASKGQAFVSGLQGCAHVPAFVEVDIFHNLQDKLAEIKPDIVIHTIGPFQDQSYTVAEACLMQGCHYIDLADARVFVGGISRYDARASKKGVLVVSGASSVPCLTAAILDAYLPQFSSLEKVSYGITAAQQTNRGLATTTAIFSYVGKPFSTLMDGLWQKVYGWQNLRAERYPELGWRLFGNCDIPDLDLFPQRYPALKSLHFQAGHELPILHLGLWGLSWMVRLGFIASLEKHASLLFKLAACMNPFSRAKSGFHMHLSGRDHQGAACAKTIHIIARSGHGPYIPCMPAILLAKGLASGHVLTRGARPCLDLIDMDSYLHALKVFDISFYEDGSLRVA